MSPQIGSLPTCNPQILIDGYRIYGKWGAERLAASPVLRDWHRGEILIAILKLNILFQLVEAFETTFSP